MRYFEWDKEIGIVKAVKICGSVKRFQALRDKALRDAASEFAVYIGGKTLTFAR